MLRLGSRCFLLLVWRDLLLLLQVLLNLLVLAILGCDLGLGLSIALLMAVFWIFRHVCSLRALEKLVLLGLEG